LSLRELVVCCGTRCRAIDFLKKGNGDDYIWYTKITETIESNIDDDTAQNQTPTLDENQQRNIWLSRPSTNLCTTFFCPENRITSLFSITNKVRSSAWLE
jgi:hypothetical protein